MRPTLFAFFVLLAQLAEPKIFSPLPGETLRGLVEIRGDLNVPGFSSAELAFAYASEPDVWFPLQTFSAPPAEPILAEWNTALLTDGDYVLHLRVTLQDGVSQDVLVSDLKIRNDEISASPTAPAAQEILPTQTNAPAPTLEAFTPTPIFPTLTPLPANPAIVSAADIFSSLTRGALIAIALLVFTLLILRLRKR
ncbi:MAG: hypothetical protein Fur002_17520 [Anaerolineales bacterium]